MPHSPLMTTDDPIAPFAEAATAFCRWAEGAPADATSEALTARLLAAEVFRRVLDLPQRDAEVDAPEISNDDYHRIRVRFGALPFNFYSEVFDPLVVPAEDEPVVGDLSDDLADIWRDLKRGLLLWERNERDAAAWEWRFHFDVHWGHHITGALYALQSWLSANPPDDEAKPA